jgi:hypothetical protein
MESRLHAGKGTVVSINACPWPKAAVSDRFPHHPRVAGEKRQLKATAVDQDGGSHGGEHTMATAEYWAEAVIVREQRTLFSPTLDEID